MATRTSRPTSRFTSQISCSTQIHILLSVETLLKHSLSLVVPLHVTLSTLMVKLLYRQDLSQVNYEHHTKQPKHKGQGESSCASFQHAALVPKYQAPPQYKLQTRNTEIILPQNTKQVDTCTLKPKNPSRTQEIFAAGSVQNKDFTSHLMVDNLETFRCVTRVFYHHHCNRISKTFNSRSPL